MSNLEKIGQEVIYGLFLAKKLDIPYYVKDNFYLLVDFEDHVFISNEEIISAAERLLPPEYLLEAIPVEREFVSDGLYENFTYGDIELRLIEIKK